MQPDHLTPTPEQRVQDAIRAWLKAGSMSKVLDDPPTFEREIAALIRDAEQRGYDRRQEEIRSAVREAGGRIVLVEHHAAGVMIDTAAIRSAESAAIERIAARLERLSATGRTVACGVSQEDADAYTAALMHFRLGGSVLPPFAEMASLVRALASEEPPNG